MTSVRTPFRVAAAALALFAGHADAQLTRFQGQLHDYQVVTVTEGLEHPWGMAFLPDGSILVTERAGRLRRIRPDGSLVPAAISGVPAVFHQGQGGLLDVALHPDFNESRLIYLSFSKPGPGGTATTAVVRGVLEGNRLTRVEEVFEADAWTRGAVHFGSRLLFDRQGMLYISVGDRGDMDQAQNRANHQGTINRIHDDGRIPEDNPFVGQRGIQPSIFAWGIRSPQGLALHPETGELWETEHGPRGGDELNRIVPGRNYGWPEVTHGRSYSGPAIGEGLTEKPGMESPVHYWVPSIATSGLMFYQGDRFPRWRGSAFVGGLAGMQIARVSLDGAVSIAEETLLDGFGERLRTVVEGPDGYIWALTDSALGRLVRLEPTP